MPVGEPRGGHLCASFRGRMTCQRAARTRGLFARAIATLALGAAVLALGCGGGSEDTTSDQGPAAAGVAGGAGNHARPREGARGDDRARGADTAPQGGAAPFAKRRAALRACLGRHGVTPPAPGGDGTPGENLRARLDQLRSAMRKCPEELSKSPQAGSGSAARLARRVEAFRACMRRHGFGPEAKGNAQRGDLGKAFAECQGPGTSAPGK
jgi:hypothetical protein